MEKRGFGIGVFGTGSISDIYFSTIGRYAPDGVRLCCVASRDFAKAERKAARYGIRAVSCDELFEDPEVDLVVNLTPVEAHEGIIERALLAGKHVYTEKTIAASVDAAQRLMGLARERGLEIGCAPDTILGASLQTARRFLAEGRLGQVTSVAASANRCNDYQLNCYPFLRHPGCGVTLDYAVYYVTAMVYLLGEVTELAAWADNPVREHAEVEPDGVATGATFTCDNESRIASMLRFDSGVTGTLHLDANSFIRDQAQFAIYGTKGILYLGNPNKFGDPVRFLANGTWGDKDVRPVELPPENDYTENSRGIGVLEMVEAIRAGRTPLASASMATHVLFVLEAILASNGSPVRP